MLAVCGLGWLHCRAACSDPRRSALRDISGEFSICYSLVSHIPHAKKFGRCRRVTRRIGSASWGCRSAADRLHSGHLRSLLLLHFAVPTSHTLSAASQCSLLHELLLAPVCALRPRRLPCRKPPRPHAEPPRKAWARPRAPSRRPRVPSSRPRNPPRPPCPLHPLHPLHPLWLDRPPSVAPSARCVVACSASCLGLASLQLTAMPIC